MKTKLKIYDAARREKAEFAPLNPPLVKMYCCGPTVYDLLHVGNFRGAVFYNFVRNWLQASGFQVKYVYNFTDVDDKILARAKERGEAPAALAGRFIAEFKKDWRSLDLPLPDQTPKATETIPQIIQLVQELIQKGAAYQSGRDVFFNIKKFPSYGALSGRKTRELIAGARTEIDEKKRDPLDFALWKGVKPEESWSWDSPFGPGRPGWHIECTAMIHKFLGRTIDIHGGGMDLIFPHHENERAQSEAAGGGPYVRFWMHNNMLTFGGDKMSKSKGNLITLREFLSRHPAEVFKYLILSAHYRSPLNFSEKSARQALLSLTRVYAGLSKAEAIVLQESEAEKSCPAFQGFLGRKEREIEAAFNDDFATPRAFSLFFEVLRGFERVLKQEAAAERVSSARAVLGFFRKYGEALSLFQERPAKKFLERLDETALRARNLSKEEIEERIQKREAARLKGDFKESDRLREALSQDGVLIQDTKDGPRYKLNRELDRGAVKGGGSRASACGKDQGRTEKPP